MAGILGQDTESKNIVVDSVLKDILLDEDDMASDSEKLAATQQSIKTYVDARDLDPAPSADHTANGKTIIGTAGEDLVFGDVVYFKSDGKFWLQDADVEATADGLLAIAIATIAADAEGTFLLNGFARDDSWSWTVGGKLFLASSGSGDFTQTAPSGSGDVVRIAGHAYSAEIIYFNPDNYYLVIA